MTATTRAASVAALALVLLGGCSAPLPQPSPQAAPAVAPAAVEPGQTERILRDLGDVLAAADAGGDAAALPARVEGPALTMRTAEYVRLAATAGARPLTALPTAAQAAIVPQTTTWPRVQVVVTEQPDDLQAPRLLVLEQASPREPYRLWGWARMLPGLRMPPTAVAEVGSPVLDPDDPDVLVPPGQVLAQYADVLTHGAQSSFAAAFADDAYRQRLAADLASQVAAWGDAGVVTETYTPADAPVAVLGTADDGGAIVVGRLTTVTTLTLAGAGAGGSIPITDPFQAALAGTASAAASLVRTYTDVVAFYVPPAGSGAQAQVLAAEHVLTAVSAQ